MYRFYIFITLQIVFIRMDTLICLWPLLEINVRESEEAIKRNWQHWVHKTQDEDKQSKIHNTTCV
jgi:hypothetical protein